MRIAIFLPVFILGMITAACGGSSKTDFNMTSTENWQTYGNVLFGNDGVVLKALPKEFSLVRQEFAVASGKSYQLVVVAKRAGAVPSSALIVDFWGPGYDNTEQEISISPSDLKTEFSSFTNVIESQNAPMDTMIRIFSHSTNAIVVKQVSVSVVRK